MPVTMTAFAIAALSMVGVPPTVGFVSKWYLMKGIMETQHVLALTVVVASTLLNAAYFLPIVYRAFFKAPPPDDEAMQSEAPWPMLLALTLTAAATVALFLYPNLPLSLAAAVAGG
jgi:multicomponent Na+:H+ antiporter subunit D